MPGQPGLVLRTKPDNWVSVQRAASPVAGLEDGQVAGLEDGQAVWPEVGTMGSREDDPDLGPEGRWPPGVTVEGPPGLPGLWPRRRRGTTRPAARSGTVPTSRWRRLRSSPLPG